METILDFVEEMKQCTPEDYEYIKLMLLTQASTLGTSFMLEKIFCFIESKRPLLLEGKTGAA